MKSRKSKIDSPQEEVKDIEVKDDGEKNNDYSGDDQNPNQLNPSQKVDTGKSYVWKYFKKVEDSKDKKTYTICQLQGCKEKYLFHGSTTTMQRHLKTSHPDICDNNAALENSSTTKQSTLTSDFKIQNLSKERSKTITRAISIFLAYDMQSINTIEGIGFKPFLNTLEPRYVLPSRKASKKPSFQTYMNQQKKL